MESRGISVLIVDDEEGVHRALARTLRHEPYDLLHAYDAGEAEAILGEHPDVRAIVCDHYMPGTLGLEFMLEVRASRPEIVAILLTAQADIGMVLSALDEGRLHRFYTKPWNGDEMRADLRLLLGLPADAEGAGAATDARSDAPTRDGRRPVRDDGAGSWVAVSPAAERATPPA